MLEEHKAVILQKYARAWLARRRFQNVRRFVLNIQLSYRVQRLQKKIEEQVRVIGHFMICVKDVVLRNLYSSYIQRRKSLLGFPCIFEAYATEIWG